MIERLRKALILAALSAAAVLVATPATAAEAPPVRTYLNGRELTFDVPPQVDQGRTLVPARGFLEALGATVTWDPATRTLTALLGESEILLRIGDPEAYVNGGPVSLDVPPRIVDGRTLVPLRFISEGFGAGVLWDPERQAIAIESRMPVGRSGLATQESRGSRASTTALRMALVARDLVGLPYAWGGTTTAGFDCSGLTRYVAGLAGIDLPRTSQEQFEVSTPVPVHELLPGDLVFYSTYAPGPTHVGIYIGGGRFVHALNETTGVTISEMAAAYWEPRYLGARRLAPAAAIDPVQP